VSLLVTRPEGEGDPLVARLRELGHRVHTVPTVATVPLAFDTPDLNAYDWVVVTSPTGARALLSGVAPTRRVRWAAVGPKTAAVLTAAGVEVDALPAESRGERIASAIAAVAPLGGLRVLLARADAAAADLPKALRAAGARADELAVYHTDVGPESSRVPLVAALHDPELTALLFASGSAVRGLVRLAGSLELDKPAVTIGPATSAAARASGLRVAAEASHPSVEGMVSAVAAALAK
jgi:uroporphyrinogen-III synthase